MTDTLIIEGTAVDVTEESALVVAPAQQAAVVVNRGADPLRYLGTMSLAEFTGEMEAIRSGTDRIAAIYKNLLRADIDYGVIPGTKNPSLLQPGAERLAMIARLVPQHQQRILTVAHAGHPDELVVHTTTLLHFESLDGPVKGSAVASCSSYEERYRWRTKERECPKCGKPSIIKGNPQYAPRTHGREGSVLPGYDQGGWLCWKKKDGCGATFADNDLGVTGQAAGKVENEEPHALINTLVQISAKRGFVGAVRHTLGITDLFTQDIEDIPGFQPAEATPPAPSEVTARAATPRETPRPAPQPAPVASGTAATFTGPVMATPDGLRSTPKGKVLAFAIKVGSSKHNVELWGAAAAEALPLLTEGVTVSVDGVRTEEDWPGRGDKPKKKVINDVTRVLIGDVIIEPGTAPAARHEAPSDPLPFGLGEPMDDDDLWPATTGEPVKQTGNPDGVVDQVGTLRTIAWATTPKGKRYVALDVLDADTNTYADVVVGEADATASFVDGASFTIRPGLFVRVMGGWSPKGNTVIASIVVPA